MYNVTHHISEPVLMTYAAGNLPQPFALVVAAHVSMCLECRANVEAHQAAGGVILESYSTEPLSGGLKATVLDLLDSDILPEAPTYLRNDIYPGPVMEALKGKPPRWRALGMGARQCILNAGPEGSVRLLYIPPGQALPDHGHNGLEMTLVLQGSFSDETGQFDVGDIEMADEVLEHTPIADAGTPCICLTATDAPLKFNRLLPRMLQPFLRV